MSVAVFIDVENIRYSVINTYSESQPHWGGIVAQCKEHGKISSFQAFGDWSKSPTHEIHEVQRYGIQPVFVPLSEWNKSSLDCYLTVAAMKLFFQNSAVDTMILGSGDRDYIPLAIELRSLGKKVVLLAVEGTLSQDLRGSVDEVVLYQPLEGATMRADVKEEGQKLVVDILSRDPGWVNLAALGFRLKREWPEFSHGNYGYAKLIDMLKEIPQVELQYDDHEQLKAVARLKSKDTPERERKNSYGAILSIKDNGYGFIRPDVGDENIFFHYSRCLDDINNLQPGDRVEYGVYDTVRGPNAENIKKSRQPVLTSEQMALMSGLSSQGAPK